MKHRNPRALLTPLMSKVLERMERAKKVPLYALPPVQARAVYEASADVLDVPKQVVSRVEDKHFLARDKHMVPVRLYAPSQNRLPVLVYFHGGGFTVGSIATHDRLCRRLSHLAQCAVVSVDYRLAPEYKFPCAHNDAWDALQWVSEYGDKFGLDTARIAVAGDSAGATLASFCAIQARDAGLTLALQLLFYPGCARHPTTQSHIQFAQGFVLEALHLVYFFKHYLNSEDDRNDWRFAPLDGFGADGDLLDLNAVAPVWLGLAECDPLVDEGIQYADRLRLAGVQVDLELYRGVVHEFIKMGHCVPEAMQAHADAARALKTAFSR